MKRIIALVLASAGCAAMAAMTPATTTGTVDLTQTVGPYRVELRVLRPETLYTRAQENSEHAKSGMLVLRGAEPVQPNAASNPNHRLGIHVFNQKGRAVTYVNVTIKVQRLDALGYPTGDARTVPVVVTQAIGKGPQSAQYGNNVRLAPGHYQFLIHIDDDAATFRVAV